MKVLHVCYSDFDGGAARAANRLHQAQINAGIDSYMLVVRKTTNDSRVIAVDKKTLLRVRVCSLLSRLLLSRLTRSNPVKHSLNVLSTGMSKLINKLQPDVVNLHWVGDNMISIGEISKINAPIVWTMHDMWAFSGCEHYDNYPELMRYKFNYQPLRENKLIDINRLIFNYKKRKWARKNIQFVSPSKWLGECAKSTAIAANRKIHIIQNPIDHQIYKPVDKMIARQLFGLPKDKKIVLFGAMSSKTDIRKGYHLLDKALLHLSTRNTSDYALVIFGAEKKEMELTHGFDTYNLGVLHDELSLRVLYSAADVYVAPSLQDNLPNTLVESFAVGTPCVAFNIGGMPDLISQDEMGELVKSIDGEELALSIERVLHKKNDHDFICQISKSNRSGENIVNQYKSVYDHV